MIDATHDPDSELRVRVTEAIVDAGLALQADPSMLDKVEHWLRDGAGHLAAQGGDQVVNLIASTVERWDPEETTILIEEKVGRDLQFIRINGTLVGGFVGLLAAHDFGVAGVNGRGYFGRVARPDCSLGAVCASACSSSVPTTLGSP